MNLEKVVYDYFPLFIVWMLALLWKTAMEKAFGDLEIVVTRWERQTIEKKSSYMATDKILNQ